MVEKGMIGGICHSINRHTKASNKYMKNYNKNEESSHIQYLVANNLYVGQCLKNYQQIVLNG